MSVVRHILYAMVDIDPMQVGPGVALGFAAAKAVQSAAEEGGKAAGGLVSRAFGLAADEIGIALGRFTAYRVGNVKRIAEIAEKKSGGRQGGIAPRLAHSLLEEGSFCDDELMAEYLGGVLAAGRTPSGRDDRAVAWSKLVTSMSTLQLRAHYVFYREWALALHGRSDVNLATDQYAAEMYCNFGSLYVVLSEVTPDIEPNEMIVHVLSGLARLDLIHNDYAAGKVDESFPGVKLPQSMTAFCRVQPTMAGIELYGWACGLPGLHPREFTQKPEILQLDLPVQRLFDIALPRLPDEATPGVTTESNTQPQP